MMTRYTYEYPRPAMTADVILYSIEDNEIYVLLIQRKNNPFKDKWAFPGGFMDIDERLIQTAYRELKEETGVVSLLLSPFKIFDGLRRDPRERIITQVFTGQSPSMDIKIKANDDAKDVQWFNIENLPELAFDHEEILTSFIKTL